MRPIGTMKKRAKQKRRPGISKSSLISSHHESCREGTRVESLMLSLVGSSGSKGSSSSSRDGSASTWEPWWSLVVCCCFRDSGISHTRTEPTARVPQAISNESQMLTCMKKAAAGGAMSVQTWGTDERRYMYLDLDRVNTLTGTNVA